MRPSAIEMQCKIRTWTSRFELVRRACLQLIYVPAILFMCLQFCAFARNFKSWLQFFCSHFEAM
jgi:hypothetical protein